MSPEVDFLEFESPQFCKYILLSLQPFLSLYFVLKYFVSSIFSVESLNTQSLNHHTYDHFCLFRVYDQYD